MNLYLAPKIHHHCHHVLCACVKVFFWISFFFSCFLLFYLLCLVSCNSYFYWYIFFEFLHICNIYWNACECEVGLMGFFSSRTKMDEISVDDSCFLVIFLFLIIIIENRKSTERNWFRFNSFGLKKWNQLDDILYPPIGSVQLIFRSKLNWNRPQTPPKHNQLSSGVSC